MACCGLGGAVAAVQQPSAAAEESPIQDNSFLIEEAYNQESGVVQHISFFSYYTVSEDWVYTFTQEWPIPGDARHQFSYTIPVVRPAGSGAGAGDLALNYRYQLLGGADARLAFSPRFSLLLPSGDAASGRGFGGVAYQANLPASIVLAPRLVSHLNVGGTVAPNAESDLGEQASVSGFNLGQSFIWLAHSRLNVMLETAWTGQGSVAGPDRSAFSHSLFLSPGIRWAHNFSSGLQIVPGVAFATGVGPSSGEKALLLYLSFEHPLGRSR
ncbi:MAG: transporter [Acidobacteria bacterium]|nr:transporter [Acidobacteriota bacterium]